MKLSSSQLEMQLEKPLLPLYIISGEDILLKQEALQRIQKAAKQAGFTERTRFFVEAHFNWDAFAASLYTTSLFAEKRLIELNFRDATPTKTAGEILKSYSERPPADTLLVINMGKLDDKTTKSAWYIAVEKNAVVVPIWPLSREQLPGWIKQRAATKYRLSLTLTICQSIAEYVEGNLIAAAQALEKIYLLKPTQIDAQCIHDVLVNESRFTVFEFVDALISDNTQALSILHMLKEDGVEPTLILWAITRELRLLAELSTAATQGHSLDALFKKHRVFARKQPLVRQCLSRLSTQQIWHYLASAFNLDQIIKGAKPGNIWDELTLFCLRK